MGNSVCYQCPDRHSECHATCEKGIAEEKRNEAARNKRYLDGIENDSVRIKTYRRKQYRQMKDGRRR
jgi:hypothetical protein